MLKQNNISYLALFNDFDIFTRNNQFANQMPDRRFFFVYKSEDTPYIGFLQDIIKATKINGDDYRIIELSENVLLRLGVFFENELCESIIFFGFTNEELGFPTNFRKYKPFLLREKSFIIADSLSIIQPDKTLKSALWQSLKELFNIV
ncbi:MAG TPA: hypothetical protein PKN57_02475 [Saprospiraceae bacterium]|nr:hypothetical protein [Saprospiraceae bacterium]MCC6688886.1 hypothetical protein [Saprospiraceae bacterium]HMV23738.1 hypothetical protein [Saprospiraceae bacterium]HMW74312.1 hypothetical protein [Saprospiraceae bacterium]HMX83120.1 hypothetical protein [Saprospiraceae bacterium]